MQAENTQFAATGTADTTVRAGKRINPSFRAILQDGEGASSDESANPQKSENPLADGLNVPVRAFLHAHKPLRFFLDQMLLVLAPCAALLGFQIDNPSVSQETMKEGADAGKE
jgi:hypothetical protein